MKRDLTKGSIFGNIVHMSLPSVMGFLILSLYDIIDLFWIGKISKEAVAGVTVFATIFWMTEVLNEIIGTSSVSLISQSYGAKDLDKTKAICEQTLLFKFIVSIITSVILLLSISGLVAFFSDDALVRKSALEYGYSRIWFLPVFFSMYSVNTIMRCVGDAKRPMYIMIVSSVLNIILDPVFMFETVPYIGIKGLGLGVRGAAYATVLSITVSFIWGISFIITGRTNIKIDLKNLLKMDLEMDKKLITIGLPTGVESLLRNLSGFILIKIAGMYGTAMLATVGVGIKLMNLVFMPVLGIFMGSGTIVGQNLGCEQVDRAKKTAYGTAILAVASISIVAIIGLIAPRAIMRFFTTDAEVIELGVDMIRIILPSMIPLGVGFGLACVFSGSGYNMPMLISCFASRWCAQIPFLWIAYSIFGKNPLIIWFSITIAEIVEMLVNVYYYIQGKWINNRV